MNTKLTRCHDCGKEVSHNAEACPHCGGPQKEKSFGCGALIASVAALLCIAGCWEACRSSTSSSNPSDSEHSSPTPRQAFRAGTLSAKDLLKAPLTAKFAGPDDRYSFYEPIGTDRFYVGGVVDSQNSFGAMIRSDWEAIVIKVPEGWRSEYVIVDGRTFGTMSKATMDAIAPRKQSVSATNKEVGRKVQDEQAATIKAQKDQLEAAKRRRLEEVDRKALEFQIKRAEAGSASAQFDVGMRYLEGRGVEQNDDTALKLIRAAAMQDYPSAKKKLAELEKR